MEILGLPNELLLSIGEYLSVKDLAHSIKTCRSMTILTSRLYQLGVQDVDGITALRWAVEKDYASFAQVAIDRGGNVNEDDGRWGNTLLHIASGNNSPDVIRILIKSGARINAQNLKKNTPLQDAATKGHVEAVEALLELGANMYCPSQDGDTPAHNAARWGHIDCVRAFINKGFYFRIRDFRGQTILHAAISSNEKMVKYLLEQDDGRSIIDYYNFRHETPLHLALRNSEAGEERIRLLLQYGAHTGARDCNGYTAAQSAEAMGWGYLLPGVTL